MNQRDPRKPSFGRRTFVALGSSILIATATIIFLTYGSRPGSPEHVTALRTNTVAPKFQKFERAATSSMSLPGTIPAGGIALMGDKQANGYPTLLYLDPATAVTGMISEAQAEQDALQDDNAPGLSATSAVLATVTAPSEVPGADMAAQPGAVIGTVAWVVTVSAPSPIQMNFCNNPTGNTSTPGCTVDVSDEYVVLSPTTGAFLIAVDS